MPGAQNIMPQRRKIYAAMQKQTRKKLKKWVQNQKLRHPYVEKAHPYVEKAHRSFAVRSACFIVFFSMSFMCLLANLFINPWKSVFFL